MGRNTVAILYNDAWEQIAKEYPGLAAAMRSFGEPSRGWETEGHFHTGQVISVDDVLVDQVVVVKHNTGERVTEHHASAEALQVLARLLSLHGFEVSQAKRDGGRALEHAMSGGEPDGAGRPISYRRGHR